MCDNLVSLRKTDLTHFLGTLTKSRLAELDQGLKMAFDLA
jgi:mRNA-degrading endonuclease toxin of MazEF toxin-antitoxin module